MSTVFSKIMNGDLPGRFVWSDECAVGILSINPLGPGHTLVVPREEVDHWIHADPGLLSHLTAVAHEIGKAVQEVFAPPRVGLLGRLKRGPRKRARPSSCGTPTRPRSNCCPASSGAGCQEGDGWR